MSTAESCICNTGPGTDGPDETCPQHGRPYSYWVEGCNELGERLSAVTEERDRLKRGGAELGKSLMFWMELAKDVTNSDDVIEEDGDGDWGVVAERLAAMKTGADRVAHVEAPPERVECCASGRCEVCSPPGYVWGRDA